MARAGTPKEIIDKVNADITAALKMPDVVDKLTGFGAIPAPNTPAQFDAVIKSDTERYGQLLKAAGIGTN